MERSMGHPHSAACSHSFYLSSRYALGLTDTIKITPNSAVCLTEGSKNPAEFIFRFEDDPKDKEKAASSSKTNGKDKSNAKSDPDSAKAKPLASKVVGSKVLRAKTRQQLLDPEASKTVSAKIAQHQKELHAQRQEEGIARFAGEDAGGADDRGKAWKRFISYKGEAGIPKEAESLRVSVTTQICFSSLLTPISWRFVHVQIHIDRRNQTLVLPINGFAVPFHVNTLKTVSKSDEGDFTYLRINFQVPGSLAGKKEDAV
jgi:FACT complex subunit SPT16